MKKLLAITALSAALFFGQTVAAEEKAAEEVKPSHVEMVLVLDESGSMSDLTRDTIGGFNSMIEKEKKLDVDAHVTTVLFNDQYKMLYNRRELKDVRKMTDKDYTPGGMTALLDAVGRTIHKMDMVVREFTAKIKEIKFFSLSLPTERKMTAKNTLMPM